MTKPQESPFEIVDHLRLHDGFVKLDRYQVRQRWFGGGVSGVLTREVVVARAAVAVICYDPDRDQVVLVEQPRLPAQIAGFPAIQTEIVAGLVEPGEAPAAVAFREVAEETGLTLIGQPVLITHMVTTPGHSTESVHVYCGRVDAAGAGGYHGLPEENEDLRVIVLDIDHFAAGLADGRIANSFTLVAGFWLLANRQRLRDRWLALPA